MTWPPVYDAEAPQQPVTAPLSSVHVQRYGDESLHQVRTPNVDYRHCVVLVLPRCSYVAQDTLHWSPGVSAKCSLSGPSIHFEFSATRTFGSPAAHLFVTTHLVLITWHHSVILRSITWNTFILSSSLRNSLISSSHLLLGLPAAL